MADKKEYKPTYGFSSYFDPSEINQAIYGDSVGNFLNNLNQGLTTFMGAVEGRQNAQRQMAFQANQNQLDRDFQAEQNQLDRQFKVDQQQREYNQKIGLMNHQNELDMKTIVMEADMKKAQQDKANAYKAWGDHVTMLYEDLSKRLAEDSSTNAKGLYEELDRTIQSGFDQAKAYGFKDQTEYNNWINDNWNPSKMSFKDGLEQQGRLISDQRAKNNFIGELNDSIANATSINDIFADVVRIKNNYNLTIDFMADKVIEGLGKFYKKQGLQDAQTAQYADSYMTRGEYIESRLEKAKQDNVDISIFLAKNGISLDMSRVSQIANLNNPDNVRINADADYTVAMQNAINNANETQTQMLSEVNAQVGLVDETALLMKHGIIDKDGNKSPAVSKYFMDSYNENTGQYIKYHNYQYEVETALGGAVNAESASNYLLHTNLEYDELETIALDNFTALSKSETNKLDGEKTSSNAPKEGNRKTSPLLLSVEDKSGFVMENGKYTAYKTHNLTNAKNWLVSMGKYKQGDEIPANILAETCMALDTALYSVTEDSKKALWDKYTSPITNPDVAIAGLKAMEQYGMFPTSNGTATYDYAHGIEKLKSAPAPIREIINSDVYLAERDKNLKFFKGLSNSNYLDYASKIDKQVIEALRPIVESGKFSQESLASTANDLINDIAGKYIDEFTADTEEEAFGKSIYSFLNGDKDNYQILETEEDVMSNIGDLVTGNSPYNQSEVFDMANAISRGTMPFEDIEKSINTALGKTANNGYTIESYNDLIKLMEDKDAGITARFYYNELRMAFNMGSSANLLKNTFLENVTDDMAIVYTPDGHTGIYVPSHGDYDDCLYIANGIGNGGSYSAYTGIPKKTKNKLNYALRQSTSLENDRRTAFIGPYELEQCRAFSEIKENPVIYDSANTDYRPEYVGGNKPSYSSPYGAVTQRESYNEFNQEEYEKRYLKKNNLWNRMQNNPTYMNFLKQARLRFVPSGGSAQANAITFGI